MIVANQLTKEYNGNVVLSLDHLKINEGEIIGLVGNNGAGKTTFFELLLDFIQPTSGSVEVMGTNVVGTEEWKNDVSAYLDESFLIEYLTAEEFFSFVADSRSVAQSDLEGFLAQFEDVFHGEVLQQKKYIRSFSKGNQKKVGLVSTLIGNPSLVYWDEPFANLDPRTQLKMKELVTLFSKGRTWVISSHDLGHIFDVCTRIIILDQGKVIHDIQKEQTSLEELVQIFR